MLAGLAVLTFAGGVAAVAWAMSAVQSGDVFTTALALLGAAGSVGVGVSLLHGAALLRREGDHGPGRR